MREELICYAIMLQEAVRKRLGEIYTSESYEPDCPTEAQEWLERIDELIYKIYQAINVAYPEEFPETEIEERN